MNIHRLNACRLSVCLLIMACLHYTSRTQVYVVLELTVAIKSGVVSVSDKCRKFNTGLNS